MISSVLNTRFLQAALTAALLAAVVATPAAGATIFSNSHLVTDPVHSWQVQVDVNIFDNYQGDYTKSEWQYTIHNISYDPPKTEWIFNNFGLGGLYLPFGRLPLSDRWYLEPPLVTPLNGFEWCGGCVFDDWGFRTGPTTGVVGRFGAPVGASAQLSLLMRKPVYITDTTGVLFSPAALTEGIKYYARYPIAFDIETPGVPEPVTAILTGGGLIAFATALAVLRRYREIHGGSFSYVR